VRFGDLKVPKRVRVSILKAQDFEDPYDAVRKAVKLAGGFEDTVKSNSYITIKPNLVRNWARKHEPVPKGCVTSFQVLDAVIRLTKERSSKVAIIESDTLLGTAEQAFEMYKVYDLAKKYDLELINATNDELVECEVPDPHFYVAVDGLKWLDSPEREMY